MNNQKDWRLLRLGLTSTVAALLLSCSPMGTSADRKPANHAVILEVYRQACGSKPLDTAPIVKWVGPWQLEVESWAYETARARISETGSEAVLGENNTLSLVYRLKRTEAAPNTPAPACTVPVRLRFIVLGLPQADYQITLHQASDEVPKGPGHSAVSSASARAELFAMGVGQT